MGEYSHTAAAPVGRASTPGSGPTTVYSLLPYQKRFLADSARFRIGLWARQTGKSFTSALDAVVGAMERGESWLVLSAGERQSLEWMEKAKQHARAWGYAAELEGDTVKADIQRLTIRFPKGNRIIGLPANPDTARGYSMNVILDEFAFHEKSREIWRALVPTITRGYRLVVLSTPNGQQNMFYELWSHHPEFSQHRVTIEDAAREGLVDAAGKPVNLAELKAAIDADGWRQEYLCDFLDEASALIPWDLIDAAECDGCAWDEDAGSADRRVGSEAEQTLGGPRALQYLGMDIGRKHDLTVLAPVERLGDVFWLRALTVLERTPFHVQLEVLTAMLRNPRIRRCCIDSTGMGAMLAEEAQRKHGVYRVEAVQFTAAVKAELAMPMLARFQDRRIRIPRDRALREDLHKVRKVTTASGNIRYEAERDDAGHSDRFWALALALHAGATGGGPAFGEAASQSPFGSEDYSAGAGFMRPDHRSDGAAHGGAALALGGW
jgi:phage FluMu gp28-like protein